MDSLPRVLYKYLAPERADVITKRLLRYTPLGAFNDPFEGRPAITALAPEQEARETLQKLMPSEIERAYDGFPPEVRAQLPYATFSDLAKRLAVAREPEMLSFFSKLAPLHKSTMYKKFDDMIGVLSLSEVADSLLMWSHYAASHSGFVIGFDSRHPYFNEAKGPEDELRHLRRVLYRETRPGGAMTALDGIDVFLVKSGHWGYEREWRVLRPLADAKLILPSRSFSIHLFEFPADAIKEVIIGARASDDFKRELCSTIREDASLSHILVRQSIPHDEHFSLRFVELAFQR
jgi:hypothetical protein